MNFFGAAITAVGAGIVWAGYKAHSAKAVAFGTGTAAVGGAWAL